MPPKIDTLNEFFVGAHGDNVAILKPVVGELSAKQAIRLAAWLVSMTDVAMGFNVDAVPAIDQFNEMLEAINGI